MEAMANDPKSIVRQTVQEAFGNFDGAGAFADVVAGLSHVGMPVLHLRNMANLAKFRDHPDWDAAYIKLRGRFTMDPPTLVAMIGNRGTGKTQVAVALSVWARWREGVPLRDMCYTTAQGMFEGIKADFKTDAAGAKLERFKTVPFLVIDELHLLSGASEWQRTTLTEIIDSRYVNLKRTIVISNHESADDFISTVGSAVADRLNEIGGILRFEYNSFRSAS